MLPSFEESDEYETSLRYVSEVVARLFAHDLSGMIVDTKWVYLGSAEASGGGSPGGQGDAQRHDIPDGR
jgi:hypothetical protein